MRLMPQRPRRLLQIAGAQSARANDAHGTRSDADQQQVREEEPAEEGAGEQALVLGLRPVPELVTESANRLDLLTAGAKLFADRRDVDINRPIENRGVTSKGGVDDLVARQHAPRLACQQVHD